MADVHGVGDEEEDSLAIGTILNEFVIGNTDEGSPNGAVPRDSGIVAEVSPLMSSPPSQIVLRDLNPVRGAGKYAHQTVNAASEFSASGRPVPAPRMLKQSSGPMLPAVIDDVSSYVSSYPVPNKASSNPSGESGLDSTSSAFSSRTGSSTQSDYDRDSALGDDGPPVPAPRRSLAQAARRQAVQALVERPVTSSIFSLRPYQNEISRRILQYINDIVVLPTNTGKTAIATNAIREHFQTPGAAHTRKILFVVPKVVLADQQLEVIRGQLEGLPPQYSKAKRLTGGDVDSMDELESVIESSEWSVVVATPQTVFNYFLAFEHKTMKVFSMMVFDECHNATGNSSYNRLLHEYMDEVINNGWSRKNMPQLVGLTATVGIGSGGSNKKGITMTAKEHVIALCSRLDLTMPPTPLVDHPLQLVPSVTDEKLVEDTRRDPFSRHIREIMSEIIEFVTEICSKNPLLHAIRFKPPAAVLGPAFTQYCVQKRHDLTRLHDDRRNSAAQDCIVAIKHLEVYCATLLRANICTTAYAVRHLIGEINVPELRHSQLYQRFKDEWQAELETLASEEDKHENEKLVTLKNGMTDEEAKNVMERFKEGDLNVLVSTSVLSEGIDIPQCRGLIRYMFIKDVVAQVQETGRMRSTGGKIVAIVDSKLQGQHRKNKVHEATMDHALQEVRAMDLDEFQNKVRQQQKLEYDQRLEKRSQVNAASNTRRAEAKINCQQCGSYLGELTSVRRYLEAHYLIVDKHLLDKVIVKENAKYKSLPMDGMADIGLLICKESKCESQLGKAISIKISGLTRKAGIWDIEKIRLVSDAVLNQNHKKWDDVGKSFIIAGIKQGELRNKASNGYFL